MTIEFIPNAQKRINEMFAELQNFEDKFNEEIDSIDSDNELEDTIKLSSKKLDYLKEMQKEYDKLKVMPYVNKEIALQVEESLNYNMRYIPIYIEYHQDIVKAYSKFCDKLNREFA